jgi:PAS domain S-box-containing protein
MNPPTLMEPRPSTEAATERTLRVLVVDDTPANRILLAALLGKMGHEVLQAEDGEQAIMLFHVHAPDVVLMDVMMPRMDGLEATRRIKALARERWVPVIMLSALGNHQDLLHGLAAGADDYLVKPVHHDILAAKLRSVARTLALQATVAEDYRRLQAISNAVTDGLITIDGAGVIQSANPAAERMFGFGEGELLGWNVSRLMPEPHRIRHDDYLAHYRATGEGSLVGQCRELAARHRDGHEFPVELSVNEMMLGERQLFVGLVRDVSARKRAERTLQDTNRRLQDYHDRAEGEHELARQVMERQLLRPSLDDPALRFMVRAATHFSGDLIAAARSDDGRLYVLLSDATGHGLAAAISVLPVTSLFYSMVRRNLPLKEILQEIDFQLQASMPTGRFVAATLLMLDEGARRGEIWNGGLPDALLLDADGSVRERFPSQHVPLGIADGPGDMAPRPFAWDGASQLVICSDGLIEAGDADGRMFGAERLETLLRATPAAQRFDAVQATLAEHMGEVQATDDLSLVIVDCRG